jgi:molecular chaperone Hsp33
MNQILNESYQTNSEVIIGKQSDQSILVTKLPPLNGNVLVDETVSRKDYIQKNQQFFHDVFEMASDDIEKIVAKFEDHGLAYLGSRQLDFFCPCSQERMVLNLRGLYSHDINELFQEKDTLEIKCDYCRKEYHVSKADVLGS